MNIFLYKTVFIKARRTDVLWIRYVSCHLDLDRYHYLTYRWTRKLSSNRIVHAIVLNFCSTATLSETHRNQNRREQLTMLDSRRYMAQACAYLRRHRFSELWRLRWKTRRTTLGDRAFPVTAARAWNALPSSVRSAPSLLQFRRDLKTALFQSSYSSP